MPRFTLTHLLKGTALFAIVLFFTQTEGCGRYFSMVETLSFSSDGSRLVVSKLSARDSQTPGKFYKFNVSRTVSWLSAIDGGLQEIIHQDFQPGNCGPAFQYWRPGRKSALCNPSNDRVGMIAFGGGDVTLDVGSANEESIPIQHPAFSIGFSKSGRFLAASGMDSISVWDTKHKVVDIQATFDDYPFLHSSLLSFLDDTRLLVADHDSVHLWDIENSLKTTIFQEVDPWIDSVAVSYDYTIVICSDGYIRRYDLSGQPTATLEKNRSSYLCSVSADGRTLAVGGNYSVRTYDLVTNSLINTTRLDGVSALALSSDGQQLAIGHSGRVTLINTKTGEQAWSSNPPARHRWPWTLPASILVVWGYYECVQLKRKLPTSYLQEQDPKC